MYYAVEEIVPGRFMVTYGGDADRDCVLLESGKDVFDSYDEGIIAAISNNFNPLRLS
jgi:hypothetical protein